MEFALLLPLLLLLLVGVFDLGRGVVSFVALAHSAREGARIGIYTSSTDSDIRDAVRSQAGILGDIPDGNITISPAYPRQSGSSLAITVVYDFTAATPLISSVLGGGALRMTGATTVRVD